MKQLTKEQAINLYKSKVYENWTDEQVVRLQLFQKKLCVDFNRFHIALNNVLGRPVYTHDLCLNYDDIVSEYLGTTPPPTLDEILNLIPKEKQFIIE